MDTQLLSGTLTMEQVERLVILETLKKQNFNRTHTAKVLRIGIRTLQRKIRQYQGDGIDIPGKAH